MQSVHSRTFHNIYLCLYFACEPGTSVQCLATGWTTMRSRFDSRQRQEIFPLASVSRPDLESTQPPVEWVPWVLSPGVKRGRGVTLTIHPHLVPRSPLPYVNIIFSLACASFTCDTLFPVNTSYVSRSSSIMGFAEQ
jgi:hypothetical protein